MMDKNYPQNSGGLSDEFAPNASEEAIKPTKPLITVRATRTNMEAELHLQRTGTDTLDPLYEDMTEALNQQGITYGIDEAVIRQLCAAPVYNQAFVVARGKAPTTGRDGYLEYLVDTHREIRPRIREDGTADFKDIGYIQQIVQDQELCRVYPPEKGEDGRDVKGNLLEGLYGAKAQDPAGDNTWLDEENGVLRSSCEGHVHTYHGRVSVANVLRVPGHVDNSTGNIDFTGDVIIDGDVASGFSVVTKGSIVVRGSVGASTLQAGGYITIGDSMNGMDRGKLLAGDTIKCRYIQNSEINAGGNIYADSIMHCITECAGDVELSGKRAALIGGRSSIAGKLLAKAIGSSTHIATEIMICPTGLDQDHEVIRLNAKVKELDGELRKLVQILNRFEDMKRKIPLTREHLEAIQKVRESFTTFSTQRQEALDQIQQVKDAQLKASQMGSCIQCKDRVHTGTRISFGPLVMQVNESFVHSRISVIDGDIRISPL